MDNYEEELDQTLQLFRHLPQRLTEDNVRILGNLNHFETFEEADVEVAPGLRGKRISLSGSIVVLDIDFACNYQESLSPNKSHSLPLSPSKFDSDNESEKINDVVSASISLSNSTSNEACYAMMSSLNDPNKRVLSSLREPRLESFGRMLEMLSKCDRYSTKDVDCFKALRLISHAIHIRNDKSDVTNEATHSTEFSRDDFYGEFGRIVMNPPNRLGLAFEYLETSRNSARSITDHEAYYAFMDISPGSRPQYRLRNFKKVDDWINTETGEWKVVGAGDAESAESRAELCLTLEPPVVISDVIARELDAVVDSSYPEELDQRWIVSSYSAQRHPRFASIGYERDDFDVTFGNMLPFSLVRVTQIPLKGPFQIRSVLGILRQFRLAYSLIRSVVKGGEPAPANEAHELNLADALELRNQAVYSRRIPLSISWRSVGENIEIDIVWVISDLQVCIELPRHGPPHVKIEPPTVRLNLNDVEKLIRFGKLDLALSYAVSSSGRLHRRSTKSFSS